MPFLTPVFGGGFPYQTDYRKKGTLIQTSLLEDLDTHAPVLPKEVFFSSLSHGLLAEQELYCHLAAQTQEVEYSRRGLWLSQFLGGFAQSCEPFFPEAQNKHGFWSQHRASLFLKPRHGVWSSFPTFWDIFTSLYLSLLLGFFPMTVIKS